MKRIAVFPGSFDPITNGHIDIIERGSKIFDEIVVAVAENPGKSLLFTISERVEMIEEIFNHREGIRVDAFSGLLIDYVKSIGACVVIRGLRVISDFEYEFQMALMNRRLAPDIETLFMMPNETYTYVSSRLVREIASLGGSVRGLVPPLVEERMRRKFKGLTKG
ncbi:MAG: pantetheine-phosphate adenylyltransferase [Acidobacteria bacterium]|nr:pantetheine-phosphate adenylyltransferase [Acidobacteriota bacterium]